MGNSICFCRSFLKASLNYQTQNVCEYCCNYDYQIAFLNSIKCIQYVVQYFRVSHNFHPRTQNGNGDLREVELFSSSVSVKAQEDEEVRMYLNFKINF